MKLKQTEMRLVAVLVTIAAALMVAPGASAAPAKMTAQQQAKIYTALVARGVDAQRAQAMSTDPTLAAAVQMSSGSSETSGRTAKGGSIIMPKAVGTECSGYSGWVQRAQWGKNIYGQTLWQITLKTTFCYNYSRVTYASSSKTHYVSAVASAGGWYFSSWSDFSEGFYAYNGHTNGGVVTVTQGYFRECVLRIGCVSEATLTARTYAHYDGTWYASGYTAGG